MNDPITIVFVLFDNVTQLDFAGPVQFLSRMPGARIVVASKNGQPVSTDCGFSIVPTATFADCPQADILCVPGGHGVREAIGDPDIVGFVAKQADEAKWITSVCTGAFILGAADLLTGKNATCHWAYTHLLPLYGAVHSPGRVVRDGNMVTSGGVTSGIDFALELMAVIAGKHVAQSVQLALEYDPAPPFDGGTPDSAPDEIVANLRERVYDKAAADLEQAIRSGIQSTD